MANIFVFKNLMTTTIVHLRIYGKFGFVKIYMNEHDDVRKKKHEISKIKFNYYRWNISNFINQININCL